MQTITTLIEIRGLTRRSHRSGQLLLDHIDLKIEGGARIGVIGPTGSGKSSLMRAIAMLDRCEAGEVSDDGSLVSRDSVPDYRRRVVYLAQRPAFVAGTVDQNLSKPFQFQHSVGQLDRNQVKQVLNSLGQSSEMLAQPVEQLSGGQQQVIALIRALSLQPTVLLLDEPTASLDAETATAFEQAVLNWHAEQRERAFVWTSHDRAQVARMTTCVLEMRQGVLREGDADA